MTWNSKNSFNTLQSLGPQYSTYEFFNLNRLAEAGYPNVARLPFSLKILLENLLRYEDGVSVTRQSIESLLQWDSQGTAENEIAFRPARVLLQDFTGVPTIVDLAAMREAIVKMGGDPKKINPLQPCDLVIDHSVQVDFFGQPDSLQKNNDLEFQRNQERYQFLRWGQQAFNNFRVVPPDTGIVHQVNLEYLASVVFIQKIGQACDGKHLLYPDTLVGTDSHTTMINGLGVLGWGVGGIEAEAAMLGQPISMLIPQVVGLKLLGNLPAGSNATDLVLTITELLRRHGVVGKFVEFFGPGLENLSLETRATLANMAPEYGATMGFFPLDEISLRYLQLTGRGKNIDLIRAYLQAQGLFRDAQTLDPLFTEVLEINLEEIEPSIAGPRRPQDRVPLKHAKFAFKKALQEIYKEAEPTKSVAVEGEGFELHHGDVVIAAITSCTNTSNPVVMLGAGILAQKAVAKGLKTKPWVKTSLAPGSIVVTEYLKSAGLLEPLEKLGFGIVGYGCTTCIGNSGPLPLAIAKTIEAEKLVATAVLSGNRNFEGRINPHVKANYLASPPLVIAYALAGTMDIDFETDSLGKDFYGKPVFLRDLWPEKTEILEFCEKYIQMKMFDKVYETVFLGDERWRSIVVPAGDTFSWDPRSTYIKHPPYFEDMKPEPAPLHDIREARVLALLGDSVTTDHISPAGSIPSSAPAGQYLISQGIEPAHFNSYGARRGNHEVMVRGTFANIRLKNYLVPGSEGGVTLHFPSGETTSIYEASTRYKSAGIPLIVIAGKEYGTGSSRDWAAKGTQLLGVRAVLAFSFERIHRSNLVGMGVLPLQFEEGQNVASLELNGHESFDILGLEGEIVPKMKLKIVARREQWEKTFEVILRIDTPDEAHYYRHGGILPFVLRQLLKS